MSRGGSGGGLGLLVTICIAPWVLSEFWMYLVAGRAIAFIDPAHESLLAATTREPGHVVKD
jgi:hypothetical protein